jgi:hypothetical protein
MAIQNDNSTSTFSLDSPMIAISGTQLPSFMIRASAIRNWGGCGQSPANNPSNHHSAQWKILEIGINMPLPISHDTDGPWNRSAIGFNQIIVTQNE